MAQCAAVIHPNLVSVRESVVLNDKLTPTGERKPYTQEQPVSLKGRQFDDVFAGERCSGAAHHDGMDGFAPALVRDADDRYLQHRRMLGEHRLDLHRMTIHPRREKLLGCQFLVVQRFARRGLFEAGRQDNWQKLARSGAAFDA